MIFLSLKIKQKHPIKTYFICELKIMGKIRRMKDMGTIEIIRRK